MNRAVEKHFHGPCRLRTGLPAVTRHSFVYNRNSVITLGLALVTAVLLAVSAVKGPAQTVGNRPVSAATPTLASESIHLGDVVDVDFVGSFEFDWRGGLTPDGFLDGLERAEKPIFALCRTEAEVAASVKEQHKYFLRDPDVVVRIVDRSNRALAYVTGSVRTAQRFQLRRSVSLLELIVLSGGITDGSNGEIVIFRPPNVSCGGARTAGAQKRLSAAAEPKRISIKIADLLSGDPDANPRILSGDVVSVTEAPPVFLIGDVATPRKMNLTPDLTLTRAIAFAGGISRSFSGQKARIHRRTPEAQILEFDLRRVLQKKVEDPKLEPYDVIEVEQRGFDSRKVAPVSEPPALNSETMSRLPLRIVD